MKSLKKIKVGLVLVPVLIFTLGMVTLLSISPERANNQLGYFAVGALIYIFLTIIDYRVIKYYWKPMYAIIFGLLILTYIFGQVRYGSARWFGISSFTFQPSEFAKIVVVLVTSAYISFDAASVSNLKKLFKLAVLILPLVLLVVLQPDLGTSIVIFASVLGVLYYAGIRKSYFVYAFILLGAFSSPVWNMLRDYQKERILVFLNPKLDVLGSGYNVIQSIIAVGSGQVWGRGFGRGTQSHLQFLPAYWTDFIFASFVEEWGFVGTVGLVILFFILLILILRVAVSTSDTFGSLVCIGVFIILFVQFVVNVGMNLGIMPVTGIPLPLVSYGGSSLVSSMILLGLVQSVWIRK